MLVAVVAMLVAVIAMIGVFTSITRLSGAPRLELVFSIVYVCNYYSRNSSSSKLVTWRSSGILKATNYQGSDPYDQIWKTVIVVVCSCSSSSGKKRQL